jgi:hypothetical protein
MPCGFSTNGLDARLADGFELFISACTWVVVPAIFVSRTRLTAWTKAAHVGAKKKKKKERID